MKRCRITVLSGILMRNWPRNTAPRESASVRCSRKGKYFYADYAKPDGFCDEAWKAILSVCFRLGARQRQFYYGDWIEKPGVAICSCNDGLRPVIFKVERTDEEATINYTPNHD